MSSERRLSANKRNARLSLGPRSPAGKARVSRNALRHGLAVGVLKDPSVSAEIDRLARVLTDGNHDGALLNQARIIAEAEFDLKRIQMVKVSLLNSYLGPASLSASRPDAGSVAACVQKSNQTLCEGEGHEAEVQSDILGTAMIKILPQLSKLHRYERRARSRRKRAVRNLLERAFPITGR
jgi:hypothetical protein